MSSYKRIKLFENERKLAVGEARRSPTDVKKPAETVQDISVLRMLEQDTFQLVYGTEYTAQGQAFTNLFITKSLKIQQRKFLHTKLIYIDKAVDSKQKLKKIVTFGIDCLFDEAFNQVEQLLVLKIWNWECLINNSYEIDNQLTGGTYWSKNYQELLQNNSQFGDDQRQPYQVPILDKGKPIIDDVQAVRFSKDASLAAVVLKSKSTGDVTLYLYRLINRAGNLIPERIVSKPLRTFKVDESKRMGNVIDVFIFKQNVNSEIYYNMYLLLEKGILFYPAIDKHVDERLESVVRLDEITTSGGTSLKPDCNDFNYITNQLVVGVCKRDGSKIEHKIRNYSLESMVEYSVDNDKKFVRFFKNLIMSVEEASSRLQIYDVTNGITCYWTTQESKIMQVEVDEDAVYYLQQNTDNNVELCQLREMESNEKIKTLIQKFHFDESKKIAKDADFPADVVAEISQKHADWLYQNKKYDEAILQYKSTIGFLNPSYVIERFIQVPQLDNLIEYLEKLTQRQHVHQYEKDYTALLLNCYVKREKFDKIKIFIQTFEQTKTIFDVATAIQVCREDLRTREFAIALAIKQKEWSLLVQIYIDDESKLNEAIDIIENEISRIRNKVDILKIYGAKMLQLASCNDRLITLIKNLIDQLVKGSAVYGPGQQPVKLEEILLPFANHADYQRQLLEFIIQNGDDFKQKGITDINLHHRLLECYLSELTANSSRTDQIKTSIASFMKQFDKQIDKNYVLFLFQIYQYNEGVKDACKSLKLCQELLTYYIQNNQPGEVLEWCKNHDGQHADDRLEHKADLWVQALTYFRDLNDVRRDDYLKKSLEHISEKNLLQPLEILEILAVKGEIQFEVLSQFLTKKLKDDLQVIKLNNEGQLIKRGQIERSGVKQLNERIDIMYQEIDRMRFKERNYEQKNCSHCKQELRLPTVHFLCGHTFCESCANGDHIKKCNIHDSGKFLVVNALGVDEKVKFKDEKFSLEVWSKQQKFDQIPSYIGQGMLALELDQEI